MRWRWLSTNPIEHAEPPPQPAANPQPPTAEEAARILNEAWADPDWAVLVWLTMVTGFRRGELCALRWHDLDLVAGVLSVERSIAQLNGQTWEKDTKTHQHRRIALDPETVALLTGTGSGAWTARPRSASTFLPTRSCSRRRRTVRSTSSRAPSASATRASPQRLGIKTTIHKLRHYSATELISGGVDVRTVAGRLGHGGGGTTTLRVYAAWVSEADQRASTRPPERGCLTRPTNAPGSVDAAERAAAESVRGGGGRPACPDPQRPPRLGLVAAEQQRDSRQSYNIAVGTAHRAVGLLGEWGLIDARRGHRPVVLDRDATPDAESPMTTPAVAAKPPPADPPDQALVELVLRRRGEEAGRLTAAVTSLSASVLRKLLGDAIRRTGEDETGIGEYEMEVRHVGASDVLMTFVTPS